MSLEAYRAHQRTMRAFLESQRAVITRLLKSKSARETEGHRPFLESTTTSARPSILEPINLKADETMSRFTVGTRPSPITRAKSQLSGVFLVVSDSLDIARSLEALLAENGAKPDILPPSSLCDSESSSTAVKEVRGRMGPIAGLIFAQGIGRTKMPASLNEWRYINHLEAKALFFLLQAVARDLQDLAGHVLVLSAMGGRFGRDSSDWQGLPTSGAAVGLIKTAAIEWPNVSFKAIDFDDSTPGFVARTLLEELLSKDDATEIGYRREIRHVFEGIPAPLLSEPSGRSILKVEPDWIILATGGARGITAEALCEILLPGMTLHLMGRAPEPAVEPSWSREAATAAELRKKIIARAKARGESTTPALVEKEISAILRDREIQANLERFRLKGVRVVYHSADVRDEAGIEAIINSIYQDHGRIDAVIHGAGIIEDKLLIDKTAESFHRVFDTKADSTWLLSRHLRPDSLKCLAFFASVAGRTGNRGQCDYAAANEVVNRFAWWLHRRWPHVKISAINWGPWESGMASAAEINRRFRERGVIPIPPAEGRAFFKRELLFGPPDEVEIVAGIFELPGEKEVTPVAWPLLQGAAVDRAGDDVVWECSISRKNYPFLEDHRIDDKIVVPWAVAVELMAETAQAAWPNWHVTEARNHQQMQGIILEDDRARALRVTARLKESAEFLVVEAMISDRNRPTRPFYQATFVLRTEPLNPLPSPPLSGTAPASIPTQTFYAEHAFHGPSFRLIDLITGLDESGVDAAISPRGRGWNWLDAPWIFQPGILDTAMQVGSFWTQPMLNSFALPTRAARVVRYGAYNMSKEESSLLVRVKSATEQIIRFDFFVLNKQGMVFLSGQGVEMTHSKALLRLALQGPPV
jgi:NAD(P)-dependent dehydrogenase (short-subunit alcohol dehydrogenase family)